MITFTDSRLYLKGIGSALLKDRATGNIVYQSDKFQSGSITPSADMGEITAGLGSGIATMISSNARVAVEFTAADFSLFAKAAEVGAAVTYGAPAPTCQTVAATGASLTIDVSGGTPVPALGQNEALCYVLEVGAAAPVATAGVAYPISADGTISGFTATSGKTYKVWYHVSRANAQLATLRSIMDGRVLDFTAEFAVYSNVNTTTLSGNRVGTFYVHIPLLKLQPGGTVNGDQTTADTTVITGQALMDESGVVSAECEDCGNAGSVMAYYAYIPCDTTTGIVGLALVGGVVSVPQGGSTQANFKLVMADGSLATPDQAKMTYTMTTAITGVSVNASGVVSATASATGDGEVLATYTDSSLSLTCPANVSVVSA